MCTEFKSWLLVFCSVTLTTWCLGFFICDIRPFLSSPSLLMQAWVANYERPRMNANSLLASPTGLSPYLRFGCLSCRLFYYRLWDLYKKVSTQRGQPSCYQLQQLGSGPSRQCSHPKKGPCLQSWGWGLGCGSWRGLSEHCVREGREETTFKNPRS